MQPVGRNAYQNVARRHARRVHKLRPLSRAQHEARHVEVVALEHARHLRRLAPD